MSVTTIHTDQRSYLIDCVASWSATTIAQETLTKAKLAHHAKVLLISDDNVSPLYAQELSEAFEAAGHPCFCFTVVHGEQAKTLEVFALVMERLAELAFSRSDAICALGGGVVGDLSGYAAASYMRGIAFIQIPTSLLAMVDSSVGGKTAINLAAGKNLVGAFWQPHYVVQNLNYLKTLPATEWRDAFGEILKYAFIEHSEGINSKGQLLKELTEHAELFCKQDKLLEEHIQLIEKLVTNCVELKRIVVERDTCEHGLRQLLNFGHTLGHALEAASSFTIGHGRCVGTGIALIALGTASFGICSNDYARELCDLLVKYDLLVDISTYTADELYRIALHDKKRRQDAISVVLPMAPALCEIRSLSFPEFSELTQNAYRLYQDFYGQGHTHKESRCASE